MRFSSLAVLASLACAALAPLAAAAPTADRLTIGLSQEPDTLHPILTTMTASQLVRNTVIHPIAAVNEAFQWECWLCVEIPTLANGGAKIIDEGGKKKVLVTWQIRPDAAWGDGQPVTGEDMRLAWRIGTAPTVTKPSSAAFDGIEAVIVDPKDPKRFTLKYKEPRYDFNQLDLTFVPIPSHIEGPIFERTKDQSQAYEKQTAYVTDPTNPGLYDAGYRVAEIKPGSHVLVVRNERFGGPAPKIKSLLFKILPNTQSLEANLMSGSIDMIGGVGVTFDQALAFEKRQKTDPSLAGRFKVTYMEDLIFEHLDFNTQDAITGDVAVRRALLYAVDRDKMCQALFEMRQKPALHPYHPLSPYFTDAVERYAYDADKAKALLDAAGWIPGPDGVRVKDGKRLQLSIMSTAQNKTRELVEVFLQEAWRKVGVQLEIRNEPARTFFGETLPKRAYGQVAMYATTLTSPDDIQHGSFSSTQVPAAANGFAGSNYAGWRNAAADAALEQAKTEIDSGKRKVYVQAAIKEIVSELPMMPLYYRAAVQVVPASLRPNQVDGVAYPIALKAHLWGIVPTSH